MTTLSREAAAPGPALTRSELTALVREIVDAYPPALRDEQTADVDRIVFHLELVRERVAPGGAVCDLGGGIGTFSVGCAALGYQAILVDDFGDDVNRDVGGSILDIHRARGVEVVARDFVEHGLELPPESLDAVTCFDSMEHWHHSPKALFASLMQTLRPGGSFILAVPNCVNLRKRLTVPLGRGKWSSMEHWYEAPRFRGHVREPDVDDLLYIARDMGLANVRILGRNWLGYAHPSPLVRRLMPLADRVLRRFPRLSANIYVLGERPAAN